MTALLMQFNPTTLRSDMVHGRRLPAGEWLETVIHTSLFTDRRAINDELPAGETDPRGYWGDDFQSSYGSLLWTLRREKITETLLLRVRAICLEALNWLVRDGHVDSVDVIVSRSQRSRIDLRVITRQGTSTREQAEVFNAA